jgi:MarR family transcriptional regulator, transcriptional regulator for hemolysin
VAEGHTTLAQWLAAAAAASDRALDRRLAGHELNRSTWRILNHLVARNSNQADLARLLGITGTTVSQHLQRLEVRELILRYRDPYDRRLHVVEVTDSGRRVAGEITAIADDHDQRLRRFFDEAEATALIERLRRLVERLDVDEMNDRAQRRHDAENRALDEILRRRATPDPDWAPPRRGDDEDRGDDGHHEDDGGYRDQHQPSPRGRVAPARRLDDLGYDDALPISAGADMDAAMDAFFFRTPEPAEPADPEPADPDGPAEPDNARRALE